MLFLPLSNSLFIIWGINQSFKVDVPKSNDRLLVDVC